MNDARPTTKKCPPKQSLSIYPSSRGGELMCSKGRAVVDVMPSSLDDSSGSWGG